MDQARAGAAPPSPPRSGGEGRGEGAAPQAKSALLAAPDAILRYEDLRRSGRLRGEVQTFPGCEGEQWRKVERDPEGRVVSYAREGLLGGRRVRVEAVYGPDGAAVRVTVKDAATSAPLAGARPWVPAAAEADGPPRCGG
jgi:hypothetical protein